MDIGAIGVRGVDCKRLSVGAFERPATLVWEVNAHAFFPRSCLTNGTGGNNRGVLNSLYVGDAELAAYLSDTYGMPVQVSKIASATQATGELAIHTWTWGPVGMDPSSLNILEDASTPDTPNWIELFWQKGDGVVALRAETKVDRPLVGNREGYGIFKPPMQAANFNGGNFAGLADWYPAYHAEGTFSIYSDLNCKNPV
ncbi:MAG: hypothetical protein QOG31_59 [Thermoplasmata archaeon]|nr:hypothetical protein [Thermoplasmata archaeon]